MRHSWVRLGAPVLAALFITIYVGAGLVSAQGKPVRINGAIDKLATRRFKASSCVRHSVACARASTIALSGESARRPGHSE